MGNIIMKLVKSAYSNSDAINKVIGYISTNEHKPVLIGGYGFFPPTADNAIASFTEVDNRNLTDSNSRKLWHLILALDNTFSYRHILNIANSISSIYESNGHHNFFGIHTPKTPKEGRGSHIHFAIQYYGYSYYYPPLTPDRFYAILEYQTDMLSGIYNYKFKWGGDEIHV